MTGGEFEGYGWSINHVETVLDFLPYIGAAQFTVGFVGMPAKMIGKTGQRVAKICRACQGLCRTHLSNVAKKMTDYAAGLTDISEGLAKNLKDHGKDLTDLLRSILKKGRKALKGSRMSRVANGQDGQDGLDTDTENGQDTEDGQVSAFVQRGDFLTGIVNYNKRSKAELQQAAARPYYAPENHNQHW